MFYQLDFEHTLKGWGENCLPLQLFLFITVYFLYLIESKFCMLLLRSFIALLKISILKSILTRRNQKKRKYNVHVFFSGFCVLLVGLQCMIVAFMIILTCFFKGLSCFTGFHILI